jgi:site-specific DNA-methyltransferase (cytosine-N4-specific)
MISLLNRRTYNHGLRPSQHRISKTGFLKDHGGSISHNFFELHALSGSAPRLPNVMRLPNTRSSEAFLDNCRSAGIRPHPARMQMELANFFISFLTDKGDLVLDPFAGSNTTGHAAEFLGRKWIATEINREYAKQAKLRLKIPKEQSYREAAE